VAALFVDMDNFKNINDSFGHDTGDELLKMISTRIRSCIRSDDYIARLGGDEFVVLVEKFTNRHDLESIASNIIDCVSKLIEIEHQAMFVSCSIGISLYPDDTLCYRDFIKYADTAMYKAKEKGRNNYQFYSTDMTEIAIEKVLMETSMRMALERDEFVLYYQPQVDAVTNCIIGIEALVRWRHDEMGIISPDKFIPLAEETGLITKLGYMIMKEGMMQIMRWYGQGYNVGRLAINISSKQLMDDRFVLSIKELLKETACKAEYIELEVTESSIMYDIADSIEKLNEVRDLGICIAIDDFGTGYSSLSYLKRLPVDKLKIDRSFISDIPDNKEDSAITNAIIAVSKGLELDVIAEGVETVKQKEYLVQHGCNQIQGYLYYRPMPADRLEPILLGLGPTLSHNSV
jgi:diguanylate cyclase (GGDEF)-like protein